MLIKIDGGRYVNPEHITSIVPRPDDVMRIYFSSHAYLDTTAAVITFIAQAVDANESYTNEPPADMPLISHIALFLRDQSVGQTLQDLIIQFINSDAIPENTDIITAITTALIELERTHTVITSSAEGETLYYHASNPMFAGPQEQW